MTKYNKTDLTLTALRAAHKEAISAWSRACFAGEPTLKWHDELVRLENLILIASVDNAADRQNQEADEALANVDLIKEFADEQNEAMRTTNMKQQEELDASAAERWEQNYDKTCPALDDVEPLYVEDLWFKDGVAYARTPSCGCCSEIMSSMCDDYDYSEQMTDLARMAAYVEKREAYVRTLRTDFNNFCASQENG